MTPDQFTVALVGWLNDRFAPPDRSIGEETALFESGLIDSIRVLDLIAWTENATGRRIPDRSIRLENFRTARRIAEVFAGGHRAPR